MIDLMEMSKDMKAFIKWVLVAILVGVVVGLVSTAFHYAVGFVTTYRMQHSIIILLLPLGGIFIVWLYKILGAENDQGTNFVLVSCRGKEKVPLRTTLLIFVSTVVTHMFGGSSGREGAALQLGSSLSDTIGTVFKFDEEDMNVMSMCGMAAAFSALFGTPVTSAVLSIEIVSIGVMHFSALVPCIVAAVTGWMVAKNFGVLPTAYKINDICELDVDNICRVLILAVLCAFVSMLFCFIMKRVAGLYKKYIENKYLRAIAGGAIIIVFTLIAGTKDYNGAGMDIIARSFTGSIPIYVFLIKIIFTAFTLGAGFKGGEIVPAFYTGATFGNAISGLFGIDPSFGAGIGLVSIFCGVTNCPVTALILSIELFGSEGLPFFASACAVSYMLSGYTGLYTAQKIIYSKRRDERIDIMTK
ncbi:MAG: chloride channel protein [Clostridia bacterium]|nr:chloride channel protein [Clostridia bacterium]MCI2000901.1 chloride channel protein [Clostridia bacterium]MCI2015685.1 chloride channel protein [Clostridia bacterium]